MYQAIVFLPLLGAILAALIAIFGARARFPAKDRRRARKRALPFRITTRMDDHGAASHGHDSHGAHEPAAAGSRSAELITTTLL